MNAEQIAEQLKNPFPPDDIEWRVGSTTSDKSKGLALAYITNRAIQNRLDEVFGVFGWRNEFKEWKGVSQLCGISVKFEGEWITKWDGADDSATEAVKGGLSDSMKRAAYQWGIGRYLYKLPQKWVKLKPAGKSFAIDETIQLPKWALPKDYDYPTNNEPPNLQSNQQNESTKAIVTPNAQKPNTPQPAKPQTQPTKITAGQAKSLITKCTKEGITNEDLAGLIDWKYKTKVVEDLLIPDFASIMNGLQTIWKEYVASKNKAS
ncbi:MAG: ddrA [Neobacillus sp.]|jgi:hypothetical protein|nr:ddrA [Neobacillus sp.]